MGKPSNKGEWVAVEDGMPENQIAVLAYSEGYFQHYGESEGSFIMAFREEGQWMTDDDAVVLEKPEISHWMHVVPPAKSGGNQVPDSEKDELEEQINRAYKSRLEAHNHVLECEMLLLHAIESVSRVALYQDRTRWNLEEEKAVLEIERIKMVIEARKLEKE